MASITAAQVMALREKTSLPMMECKKALVEADGDEDKAVEILREQFKKQMVKRAENVTAEGRIVVRCADDGSEAVMVEVQCESAPVAGGEDFVFFSDACAEQLLTGPGAASAEELLSQSCPGKDGQTLQDIFDDMINRIREKMVVARITRVSGPVNGYVHHDQKNAALFCAEGEGDNRDLLRDVAMHITALKPQVCNVEDVEDSVVEAERTRLTDEAKASGKPDNIVEKIVDGRMKNFYVEQGVLTSQAFAKDDSKTVSQALAEAGYKAKSFDRWVIGQ